MCDAHERAVDGGLVHDLCLEFQLHSAPSSGHKKHPVRIQTRRQRAGRPRKDSIDRDTLPVSRTDLKISSCVKYHHGRQLSIRNSHFRHKNLSLPFSAGGTGYMILWSGFLEAVLERDSAVKDQVLRGRVLIVHGEVAEAQELERGRSLRRASARPCSR